MGKLADHHVVIDGFNVIFGLDSLKSEFRRSPDASRSRLIEMGRLIHDGQGCQVTIVLDGIGKRNHIEYPLGGDQFAVVYSSAQASADGVIERMLTRTSRPENMQVVTDDRLIRDAAIGCGAGVCGIDGFFEWIESERKTGNLMMDQLRRGTNSRWENRLPL